VSAARAELEAVQARCAALEATLITDTQVHLLADQLEREAHTWEQQLDKGERQLLKADDSGVSGRVMGFAFALLVVTPIVVMVGTSLSRMLRHEAELAWALLLGGLAVVAVTSWPRARRAIAHRFSRAWGLSRAAQEHATALRELAR
jgi:hypothetical protein